MSPCDVTIMKIDTEVSVNVVLGLIPPRQVAPRFSRTTTVLYGEKKPTTTTPDNCDWLGTNDPWEAMTDRAKQQQKFIKVNSFL